MTTRQHASEALVSGLEAVATTLSHNALKALAGSKHVVAISHDRAFSVYEENAPSAVTSIGDDEDPGDPPQDDDLYDRLCSLLGPYVAEERAPEEERRVGAGAVTVLTRLLAELDSLRIADKEAVEKRLVEEAFKDEPSGSPL